MDDATTRETNPGSTSGEIAVYVCFGVAGALVLAGVIALISLLCIRRRCRCIGKNISGKAELPAEYIVHPRTRIVRPNGDIIDNAVPPEQLSGATLIRTKHLVTTTTTDHPYIKANGSVVTVKCNENGTKRNGTKLNNNKSKSNNKITIRAANGKSYSDIDRETNRSNPSSNWVLKENIKRAHYKSQHTGSRSEPLTSGTGTTASKKKLKYGAPMSIPIFARPKKTKKKKQTESSRSYSPVHIRGSLRSLQSTGSFFVYTATPAVVQVVPISPHRSRSRWRHLVPHEAQSWRRSHYRRSPRHSPGPRRHDDSFETFQSSSRKSSDPMARAFVGEPGSPSSDMGVWHKVKAESPTLGGSLGSLHEALHLRWSPSMRKKRPVNPDHSRSTPDMPVVIATEIPASRGNLNQNHQKIQIERDPLPNGDMMTKL